MIILHCYHKPYFYRRRFPRRALGIALTRYSIVSAVMFTSIAWMALRAFKPVPARSASPCVLKK